jgi:hypothetical protein
MAMHFERTRECLKQFDFKRLFNELGWSRPVRKTAFDVTVKEARFNCGHVAELAGAVVLEIESHDGAIPDAKTRTAIHKEVAKLHHENLLIFVDRERTQSLWYWVKRQEGKQFAREHLFFRGQPGDLFLGKLSQMVFDLADFDAEGNVSIVDVAKRLQSALDIERVTKKFFRDFQNQHVAFLEMIRGIPDERQRRWYASVLLNRLMFIYFLQKKPPGFLDGGNQNYLRDKLEESKRRGKDRFYNEFLQALFFEGFAKPEEKRSASAKKLVGRIKYLNGGLFLPHHIERDNTAIKVPDQAFENLFDLFDRYTWHLDDTPGGQDDEINPDVLGYIFEKYINQKAFGAYYTRTEITEYLCERTIHQLILDAVNTSEVVKEQNFAGLKVRKYGTLGDLLLDLDAPLCKRLLHEVLPGLSLLDPACGSGAFLVAAMKTLINVYAAVIGRITFLHDKNLTGWLAGIEKSHPSAGYFIKKRIITDNLYGVDIMEEATEIARLRLFLALVSSAQSVDDLEPLPNIDFNILAGNSLIGLMRVNDADFDGRKTQGDLFRTSYWEVLQDKNRLIDNFRHATEYAEDLTSLRDEIDSKKLEAYETLNGILLDEFQKLGVKFEQATWDEKKNDLGKAIKRRLKPADIDAMHPFHWGFEFDEIINKRGGFDAIITNPPWEVFKPNGKEFFEEHSDVVSKKNMTIHDFEKEQARLLNDREIREAWMCYLSQFPHVSAYFRSSPQYRNQISLVNGKKAGTDINFYKLFVEQCINLLRDSGRCGMITPSGIYTDLGTTQLRNFLYSNCRIDSLFGLSNERFLFDGVDHRFKICIFSFQKSGETRQFPAAFRFQPREAVGVEDLDRFLHNSGDHVQIKTELIRRLTPESLSVMEFRTELDTAIAEKMLRFPMLGSDGRETWTFALTREFDISKGRMLCTEPGAHRLPLLTGRMFNQFALSDVKPKFWIEESVGRRHLLKDMAETGQTLDYQGYRWVHRRIARTSDSRTFISTVVPPMVFTENNSTTIKVSSSGISCPVMVFLAAVANSYCLDWMLRLKVDDTLNMFHIYSLPVPRMTSEDPAFHPIVDRAARLICTSAEFDGLAKEVGIKSHRNGVTDDVKRARLRAELDGLIAHLYGLTETEFAHILSTFPLVPDPVKVAAQNAYRDVERGLIR